MVTQIATSRTGDVFHAISDPTRRAILDHLRHGAANAGTLASSFPISRPAISRHLRILREANLVTNTQIGRERIYEVDSKPLLSVAEWVEEYRTFWQSSLSTLKKRLEEQ
jgi:DNA-binding transcriptional ArsR family regulator